MTAEVFTPPQRELLRLVLNRLVPAGRNFPAAGDLGIVDHLDRVTGTSPGARRMLLEGLRQIEMASERPRQGGFATLAVEEQDVVLHDVEHQLPEFFEALVLHTYCGYYSHPTVIRLLGYEGPPQPRGHTLEPFDAGLTEDVRTRGPIHRRP